MILIDNNQLLIANIFQSVKYSQNGVLDVGLLRHMVLNSYRMHVVRFKEEFGNIVICHDSKHCWRKGIFPQYKANRKKTQDASQQDWNQVYDMLNLLREEISDNFPWVNVKVDNTEADDIIAVLAKTYSPKEKVLIVSSDKDFQQLQRYKDVYQYSPNRKEMVVCNDPEGFLIEHIITGDSSDGVPNILSEDDVFVVEDKRQTPCGAKKIDTIKSNLGEWNTSSNWNRNQIMIDFTKIPDHIQEKIIHTYEHATVSNNNSFNYMVKHKLTKLMEHAQEFV